MTLRALARAKVNLCLHVVGQRADGRHLLDSLVAFADVGDVVEAWPSFRVSLGLIGPFCRELDNGSGNLVRQAGSALRQWLSQRNPSEPAPGAALCLWKQLPIASGVGGGSSDAATTLLLLRQLWDAPIDDEALAELGLSLGADVPVCLRAPAPTWMRGIGERLTQAALPPGLWLVLVNPGVAVATGEVFARLERKENAPPPPYPEEAALSQTTFLDWLAKTRNDLEPPAMALAPVIGEARDALAATSGCRMARMSGSGATCFGIFTEAAAALEATERLSRARPEWWIAAAAVAAAAEGERER